MAYTRKYAGPLQPGRKTAYVPGTRKNRPSYRSKPPGRLRGGKSSYVKSKRASNKLVSFGEVKLQNLRAVNFAPPIQMNPTVPNVAPVYGLRYVIGDSLSQYPNYNALGGFNWAQGTQQDQRVGNYIYFKKIHMTLQINMNQTGKTNTGPRKFRLIIFKSRRSVSPTGTTFNPNNSIMLSDEGKAFGVDTGAPNTIPNSLDFSTQITNKRNFQIYKDMTFILQNPLGDPSASVNPLTATSGQYKAQKTMKCSLPLWRKTRLDSDKPSDLNYQYGIYLQAVNVGSNAAIPDDWTFSLRGTVSANDV